MQRKTSKEATGSDDTVQDSNSENVEEAVVGTVAEEDAESGLDSQREVSSIDATEVRSEETPALVQPVEISTQSVEVRSTDTPALLPPVEISTQSVGTLALPKSEAEAVKILTKLGVEPGSVVNLDLNGLNALYIAMVTQTAKTAYGAETGLVAATRNHAAPAMTNANIVSAQPAQTSVDFPADINAARQVMKTLNLPDVLVNEMELVLMRRLSSIIGYSNEERRVFAIDRINIQTDWGTPTPYNDAANFLCVKGSSDIVTGWIVGQVASQYWFNQQGFPANRVGCSIQPAGKDLHQFCKKLLHGLCMPRNSSLVADAFGPDQVRATRWMTRRGQRGQATTTEEFKDFYDARVTLQDKSLMARLSVEQIVEHDLVLMEVHIGRYNAESAPEGKGRRGNMTKWQTFYDLRALYLLMNAPAAPETNAASDFSI
ncbi:hypothetical protein R3P38DRAFT_3609302 [Favolaschia claudopus]|uniref:Uncharacterized protein n=1 Tax=Favolaschia claudopus TaxID=2862362 RepID=A0AAW0A7Y1_9AGAR